MGGRSSADVVYLILSHVYPEQVVRLVNRLLAHNPGARVVVHHDYAHSYLDPSSLDGRRVEVIHHTEGIEWGTYSQAEAILRSLRWIEERLDYRWIVFISGQDYPLRSPVEIQDFLLASDHDAFIAKPRLVEYRSRDETGLRDFWSARYFYAYYALPRIGRRLPARAANAVQNFEVLLRSHQPFVFFWMMPRGGRTMLGIRRVHHPFNESFRCYCGSDSFTWSRKSVRVVLDFVARRPDVIACYRRSIHPSESLFNSILMNTHGLRLHYDNLRFERFAGPGAAHPDILVLGDLGILLSSGKHFARKFDAAVDDAILDALDRRIDRSRLHENAIAPPSAEAE